ncbi:DUF6966 domain-containing protein [Glutamicibacter sp. 287]|uniref:DUF6966 domain-containing protein n=1 Tax=unclassified Glutamicibacter TaxID=2627139 RepID=UPI000BB6DD70|nr:hypothetical protein [Glutamicibacter sp. BW80]PCC28786.1 hypothetical protein CIK76_08670 [Glutamicibacter sp. BW80]
MARVERTLIEIRAAIAKLHRAAAHDRDPQRAHAAHWLDGLFENVESRAQLREASRQALELYRGGMGSFQDVGTAVMAEAVDGLRHALSAARSWLLRD